MASIRRQPKSRFWIACITLPDGRQTQRSTKQTDREKARRVAERWEDAGRQAKAGRLTENQARKVVSDIYSLVNPTPLPSSTARAFFGIWLERKENDASAPTHRRYSAVSADFLKFIGPKADQDLMHITLQDVLGFRDQLAARVTPNTVNVAIKILRTAFNQALREGLLSVNEANKVTLLKRERFERQPFQIGELQKLLQVASLEWKGMILTGLYTGLRLGDIATLRWGHHVDVAQKLISLQTGKTKRRVVLPIAKPLLSHLEGLISEPGTPVFPHASEVYEASRYDGRLSKEFYVLLEKAGLAERRTHDSTGRGRSSRRRQNSLSFHCLRHTATSLLKNTGASDAVARDIVGHESSAVNAHYTHIDLATKREALNRLPDILSDHRPAKRE